MEFNIILSSSLSPLKTVIYSLQENYFKIKIASFRFSYFNIILPFRII